MKRKTINEWIGRIALLCMAEAISAPLVRLMGQGNAPGMTAGLFAGGLLGYFLLGLPFEKWNLNAFVRGLMTVGVYALLGTGYYFLLPKGPFWVWALLFEAALAWMIHVGKSCAGKAYSEILSESVFDRITVLYLVSMFLLWFFGGKKEFWPLALAYLLTVCAYGYLHNQSNMDKLTVSRHFTLDFLPEKIRSYNTALLGIVAALLIAIFAVLFVFQKPLSQAADAVRGFTIDFFTGGDGYVSYWVAEHAEESGGSDIPMTAEDPPWAGVVRFCISAGIVALFVLMIYYFRKLILDWVFQTWQSIVAWAKRIFQKKEKFEQENEFVDIDQSLHPGEGRQAAEDGRSRAREWKKAYRAYQKMPEGNGKFTAGYLLSRSGLELAGAEITPADTPFEGAQKAGDVLDGAGYLEASDAYSAAVYGEKGVSEDGRIRLDETLTQIAEMPLGKPRMVRLEKEKESRRASTHRERSKTKKQESSMGGKFLLGVLGIVLVLVLLSIFGSRG